MYEETGLATLRLEQLRDSYADEAATGTRYIFAKCTSALIAQSDDHTNEWHPPRREAERHNAVVLVQWVSVEFLLGKDCPTNFHWQRVVMLQLAIKALDRHQIWDLPYEPQDTQADMDEDGPISTAHGVVRISDELTPCPRHPQTPSDLCGRCCVRTFDQLHKAPQGEPEAANPPNKATERHHQFEPNPALQD